MSESENTICFDCLNIKGGGGITVASRVVERFALRGWKVYVLVASDMLKSDIEALENNNISVHFVPEGGSTLNCIIYRYTRFSNFASRMNTDVVFSFNYWTPWHGLQVTYHINATPFFSVKKIQKLVGITRAIVQPYYSRLAIRKSTRNFFESKYLLSLANDRYGPDHIKDPLVRYIGIDTPGILPPRSRLKPTIISITSGATHKRNDLVVELHRRLNDRGIDVDLTFGGNRNAIEGSLSLADQNYVRSVGNVKFLGYVSRETLYKELANSTALVSCSEVESFFMVPLEAMSVGCPVICSNFTSIGESVGDAGIVCAAGDLEEMENWFIRLTDEMTRDHWSKKSIDWASGFTSTECSELIVDAVADVVRN